jgi:hypothetical protein
MAGFLKSKMHYGALCIAALYRTHRRNKQNAASIYIFRSHPHSFNARMMSLRYTLDVGMKCRPCLYHSNSSYCLGLLGS